MFWFMKENPGKRRQMNDSRLQLGTLGLVFLPLGPLGLQFGKRLGEPVRQVVQFVGVGLDIVQFPSLFILLDQFPLTAPYGFALGVEKVQVLVAGLRLTPQCR